MLGSFTAWTVVTLLPAAAFLPVDPATSYQRPRFAGPPAVYLEVRQPQLKTHCCWHEEPTVKPSEKRNGIPALC